MKYNSIVSLRVRSVLPLSLFFSYELAFVFEGPAFYSMAEYYHTDPSAFMIIAVSGMCLGLLGGGFLVRNGKDAKRLMLWGMTICLCTSCVFFFPSYWLWFAAIVICSVVGGAVNSAWGYFLKICTPAGQRIKSCADVLICSNLFMILINMIAINISPFAGLGFALILIIAAIVSAALLPSESESTSEVKKAEKVQVKITAPLTALVVFITVITINSGLMYQIVVPAYEHLTFLTSWYWAVPYILALFVMRNLSKGRAGSLYLGMGMMIASFVFFTLLGRGAVSYIVVDTLMLGTFGIFDLFWWSILGEMLDLDKKPTRIFGIGLSANVFGILMGKLFALFMGSFGLPVSGITIVALIVVCITLMLLPLLNHRLTVILKNHAYLSIFSAMADKEQMELILQNAPFSEPLTPREHDVLMLVLNGKSNKGIAEDLIVSENTVKTHLRNIYGKYQVTSRSTLISMLLKK